MNKIWLKWCISNWQKKSSISQKRRFCSIWMEKWKTFFWFKKRIEIIIFDIFLITFEMIFQLTLKYRLFSLISRIRRITENSTQICGNHRQKVLFVLSNTFQSIFIILNFQCLLVYWIEYFFLIIFTYAYVSFQHFHQLQFKKGEYSH